MFAALPKTKGYPCNTAVMSGHCCRYRWQCCDGCRLDLASKAVQQAPLACAFAMRMNSCSHASLCHVLLDLGLQRV